MLKRILHQPSQKREDLRDGVQKKKGFCIKPPKKKKVQKRKFKKESSKKKVQKRKFKKESSKKKVQKRKFKKESLKKETLKKEIP